MRVRNKYLCVICRTLHGNGKNNNIFYCATCLALTLAGLRCKTIKVRIKTRLSSVCILYDLLIFPRWTSVSTITFRALGIFCMLSIKIYYVQQLAPVSSGEKNFVSISMITGKICRRLCNARQIFSLANCSKLSSSRNKQFQVAQPL